MTKEQKLEAFSMRLDGCTYQEIADRFGVTRQYIQQTIPSDPIVRRKTRQLEKVCIYEGLAEFIKDHQMSSTQIGEIIGVCRVSTYQRLTGERKFNISDIRKILDYTGMTFEECFKLKKSEVNEYDRG